MHNAQCTMYNVQPPLTVKIVVVSHKNPPNSNHRRSPKRFPLNPHSFVIEKKQITTHHKDCRSNVPPEIFWETLATSPSPQTPWSRRLALQWRWWEIEDGDDADGDGDDDGGAAMTVVRMVIVQLGWFNKNLVSLTHETWPINAKFILLIRVCNLCNLTLRPISRLQNSQFFRHNTFTSSVIFTFSSHEHTFSM